MSAKFGNTGLGQLFVDDLIDRDPVTGQTDIGAAILDIGQVAVDETMGLGFAVAAVPAGAAAYALGAGLAGDTLLGFGSSMVDGSFNPSAAFGSGVGAASAVLIGGLALGALPEELPVVAALAVATGVVGAAYTLEKVLKPGMTILRTQPEARKHGRTSPHPLTRWYLIFRQI